ncbi:MAG: 50S ribosomal protein L9 [Verrucomicrobia bacterium]|nr:MAG: 50S ribosomal protein L9 [Verrucomicrobiota bacterium]
MANSEVILTENIESLGAEADIVSVRRGYARNFLIPKGKALEVTPSSLRKINHLKAKRAEREARELSLAEEIAGKISKLKLSFELGTGESGKAFGSVTAKDITNKILSELPSINLPKHALILERSIKEMGDHKVEVKLHPDVVAQLVISVKPIKTDDEKQDSSTESASKKSRKKSSES